jgi:S1-C subfamily serine protease
MALIPPFFLDCVVALGFPSKGDQRQWAATGFLIGILLHADTDGIGRYRVFLVTNRHVVQEHQNTLVRFNPKGAEAPREYRLNLVEPSGKALWAAPEDPEIDVAVTPINAGLLQREGIAVSWFADHRDIAPVAKASELGITEGDGVFVLGFPMGLVGEKRDFALVRQGAIARIRDCFRGDRKNFLVDCATFPGNSGGPVIIRPDALAIQGTKSVNAAYLVGIVASYVPYIDVAISAQTNRPRVTFEENSGLTTCFPIDPALELAAKFMSESPEPTLPAQTVRAPDAT